jgi:mono/diheme cytochrome c family protein
LQNFVLALSCGGHQSFAWGECVKKTVWLLIGSGCVLLALLNVTAASPAVDKAKIERGKYLVDGIGLCGECHTPTDEKGVPLPGKTYHGAPIMMKPTVPVPAWADKSANIAGLPGWENADAVKFLMTGIAYNGLPARPPMPPYRMNKEDAEAVVAYLKSLAPADK